jgi:hypothetical protein
VPQKASKQGCSVVHSRWQSAGQDPLLVPFVPDKRQRPPQAALATLPSCRMPMLLCCLEHKALWPCIILLYRAVLCEGQGHCTFIRPQ